MTRAVIRKELAMLWASPLPYVVAALFHLTVGLLFVDQIAGRRQAVLQPVFPIAGFVLVVLVPVLTMRTLADEQRAGSLDVLLAIPVPARVLVVGKWLATWATTLLAMAPLALGPVVLAAWGEPDWGPLITGSIGLVLLAGALVGVGVLASSLTSSQAVAALVASTTGLLMWFSNAGPGREGRALLARVSLSERLRGFAGGVVDTADLGFFVVTAAAALTAATFVVSARRHA